MIIDIITQICWDSNKKYKIKVENNIKQKTKPQNNTIGKKSVLNITKKAKKLVVLC